MGMNTSTLLQTFSTNSTAWIYPSLLVVLLLAVWSLVWKGLALWHSGRRGDVRWFIFLLLINTVGILEIIYLFGVIKLKRDALFSKKTNLS